ncbi:MAG: trypsin-like peptidase domain-containing protein [Bdellovibrionales bacterium]|nr:trypsin-like peptidase domain-containing protein [Bdellovibrionales bacterium]
MLFRFIPSAAAGAAVVAGALILTGAHVEWPALSHASPPYTEAKPAPAPLSGTPVGDAINLSQAFSSLTDKVSPTVVNIYTKSGPSRRQSQKQELPERFFGFGGPMPFSIPDMREALGSGFVINAEEGYIVTNAHVVRQAGHAADEIMVKFLGEENSKGHAAKLIGADEVSDVALLKLKEPRAGIKAVALGDSTKAKAGEWVLAIGNPYGHTNTVTQGIVSAVGRSLEGARGEFLQTSAGINPGNSGGPLINMNGEVIGINSAIDARAQNIGFAIPINTAKDVINQLVTNGKVERAWLGIGIDDINEEVAGLMRLENKDGVLVKQVMDDAPAQKAGIQRYDVIRKIDGTEIKNVRDLYRSMAKLNAGKAAEIEVLRGGASKTLKVKLGAQPESANS